MAVGYIQIPLYLSVIHVYIQIIIKKIFIVEISVKFREMKEIHVMRHVQRHAMIVEEIVRR